MPRGVSINGQNWRLLPMGMVVACALGCGDLDSGASDRLGSPGACGESSAAPDIGAWDATAASFEQRVFELTNARRSQGGCCGATECFDPAPPVVQNANLQAAARLHARDMVQHSYFSHDGLDGSTLLDRARAAGFGGCALGENIAQGQATPEEVIDSWMQSSGHCQNILSPSFDALGVGYFDEETAELRHVWVQDFGD